MSRWRHRPPVLTAPSLGSGLETLQAGERARMRAAAMLGDN